ncbi:hypothetical protein CQW23_18799 [Capsicum baccatum]|uniref:Uncharacterized protein n=1 Tax=Capsicum baccatum TaxID=33114 RepID=A0A2G2W3Y9_CAPBA|nr:hypothetical protein CQW23_18799 [Capsicum baccatum]
MKDLTNFSNDIKGKVEENEEKGYKLKPNVLEWIENVNELEDKWETTQGKRILYINIVQIAAFDWKSPLKQRTSEINFAGLKRLEKLWIQFVGTITREPVASTSQPMDNIATNVILAYLDTMSRDLAMENERLDRMVGQREQVGFSDTHQEESHSSHELRGKNVIPYTPMNLECCVVASRSQVGVVTTLPRVEVLESPFCDTLSIVRPHEDQTLVVGMQALVDPLDDEIDSPR